MCCGYKPLWNLETTRIYREQARSSETCDLVSSNSTLPHKSSDSLNLFVSYKTIFTKRNYKSDDSRNTTSSPPLPPFLPLPLSFLFYLLLSPLPGGRGPSRNLLKLLHPYRKKAFVNGLLANSEILDLPQKTKRPSQARGCRGTPRTRNWDTVTQSSWILTGTRDNLQVSSSKSLSTEGQHPNKRLKPWTSCGFFVILFTTIISRYCPRAEIQPHAGFITQWISSSSFYHYNLPDIVYGQSSSHRQETTGLLISWVFSFFYHEPYQPKRITEGVSFDDHSHGHNYCYPQFTDWGRFLKTYPRVRILTYSPRTGARSKCLQNPWSVDLTLEPRHRRRLQDAVGVCFFTTTKPTNTYGYYTHGFNLFPTTT